MNANELAEIQAFKTEELTMWERNHTATMLRQQQAEIEALNQRIERMIEKQSHYEAMAHAGGFEAGRQQAFFDRAREVAKKIDNNEYHTPED
jgi:hypothetical protein